MRNLIWLSGTACKSTKQDQDSLELCVPLQAPVIHADFPQFTKQFMCKLVVGNFLHIFPWKQSYLHLGKVSRVAIYKGLANL